MSSSSPSPLSSVILAIEGLLVTLPHAVVGLGATTLALLAATYYLSSSRSSSASSNNTPPRHPPPSSSSHDAPSRASSSGKAGADEVDDELDATVSSDVRAGAHHPIPLACVFGSRLAFCVPPSPPHSPRNTLLSTRTPPALSILPSIQLMSVVVRPLRRPRIATISLPPEIM
jgi:hypothetical protein